MKTLSKKVAVVTGAASGIGRSIALMLAQEGCDLAICDLDEDGLSETRKQTEEFGVTTTTHRVDVSDFDEVAEFSTTVQSKHGKVNILVNNAGVALTGRIDETKLEDFGWLMGVNYWGVVHGCSAFLPILKASGDAHIVNICSSGGYSTTPYLGPYCASKFAVRGYTEALYQELHGSCVGVTCVHPGGIKTNLPKNARMADRYAPVEAELTSSFEEMLITEPSRVAEKIRTAIVRNRFRVIVGIDAQVLWFLSRLFPMTTIRITKLVGRKAYDPILNSGNL